MSSLTPDRLRAWELFFESALTLLDRLDRDTGIPIQWYDVLIHLEQSPDGLRMNELADKILYSKSGLTRVVDRMENAGLVRRYRPETDRRSILVLPTPRGNEVMEDARLRHHDWIEQNFSRQLSDTDIKALTRAFEKLTPHPHTRRPGRVNGG